MSKQKSVAYFSMEFAFDDKMPNYAGGLGVLAADIILSMADLHVPAVGVSLIYHQEDDLSRGFNPEHHLQLLDETITLKVEHREVVVRLYKKEFKGATGHSIPIIFLSTYGPENKPWDNDLTKHLYTSNWYTRLCQEYLLGVGGVRALEKLGYDVDYYHMNEGHAAMLTLELLKRYNFDHEKVKEHCTFTTHTPVTAGHDYFDYGLVYKTIPDVIPWDIKKLATHKSLGMTELALNLSKASNSVSKKHQEVCSYMFRWVNFQNVTNGIYHPRWVSENMAKLFTKYLGNWKKKTDVFDKAPTKIPNEELRAAKKKDKKALVKWINEHKNFFPFNEGIVQDDLFDDNTLTIGFARRFVEYKRPELIFNNLKRLRSLGYRKIQLVFAARCQRDNTFCLHTKHSIMEFANELRGQIRVAVCEDYNLDVAKRLVTGVDIWLNNPISPMEASGTSGMKASLNGGLNLSIKDGWWIEGLEMRPDAGWGFGTDNMVHYHPDPDLQDAEELYERLEDAIDIYYNNPEDWARRMKEAIALMTYFNTDRVVEEYQEKMWN